jgi:hypothetical protein
MDEYPDSLLVVFLPELSELISDGISYPLFFTWDKTIGARIHVGNPAKYLAIGVINESRH